MVGVSLFIDFVFIYNRLVAIEVVNILRDRFQECVRREEVNHKQNCRKELLRYNKALKQYKATGK